MKKFAITKVFASIVIAAVMVATSAVASFAEARKGFNFGVENYTGGRTISFTYYGEQQPTGWKASVPGTLNKVVEEDGFTVYNFNYKEEADEISISAYDRNGQLLEKATLKLEDPSKEAKEAQEKASKVTKSSAVENNGIKVGSPNFENAKTVTFTVYGGEVKTLSCSSEGKFESVYKTNTFETFSFTYEAKAENAIITAEMQDGTVEKAEVIIS